MSDVAHQALDMAREAKGEIETHEAVCAERYLGIRTDIGNIDSAVGDIKRLIRWAGGTITTIVLALIAFLSVRLLDVNDANIHAQQERTETLQQVVAALRHEQR